MMKGLSLPVLWNTDTAHELKKLGIECDDTPEEKEFTFFNIDHIFPTTYSKGNKAATAIISGGTEYLVEMDYESLKTLISEHL